MQLLVIQFCTMNQQMHTIISQIITLLHVSTLSCHPQTACNQYLAKLHQYFKCSCWKYNLQLRWFTQVLCQFSYYSGWNINIVKSLSSNDLNILQYWYFNHYNMRTGIKPVWNILIVNCITNSCIWNTGVTSQGIDYKLSEDDTIVSKLVAVW